MANDAFMKPEIPEPLRELMKMSIEQAKRAFETFVSTSEKTWKSLEISSPIGARQPLCAQRQDRRDHPAATPKPISRLP